MPDSARDDAGALLAEGNNLLAPCVQDDVDGPGEQDQDLVAVGVHLPMIRALGHVEGAQQATLVKIRSMLDLRPELVIDIDDLGGAVVETYPPPCARSRATGGTGGAAQAWHITALSSVSFSER